MIFDVNASMVRDQIPGLKAAWELGEEAIRRMIEERQIATEQLTTEQLASVIMQALACGDITRNVVIGTDAQCVVYIPFREVDTLRSKVDALTAKLKAIQALVAPDEYSPDRDS